MQISFLGAFELVRGTKEEGKKKTMKEGPIICTLNFGRASVVLVFFFFLDQDCDLSRAM